MLYLMSLMFIHVRLQPPPRSRINMTTSTNQRRSSLPPAINRLSESVTLTPSSRSTEVTCLGVGEGAVWRLMVEVGVVPALTHLLPVWCSIETLLSWKRWGSWHCFMCLSVCLSVSLLTSLKNHTAKLYQIFLCILLVTMTRSSSGDVALCNALPVLWMTSRILIGPMVRHLYC